MPIKEFGDTILFKYYKCNRCGEEKLDNFYIKNKNPLIIGKHIPICNSCINKELKAKEFDWQIIDKYCQWIDIPFIPKEWERVFSVGGEDSFPIYADLFFEDSFENLDWMDYYKEFCALKEDGDLESQLPLIAENIVRQLKEKWGFQYCEEELNYLENLFNGLLDSQKVSGALQIDQAIKLCKISANMDSKIRAGEDFEKILKSYDLLVKAAGFTPKNAKNSNDFDSVGELVLWLEKRGWINKYHTKEPKDIVDETMLNMQAFLQRLYTNESGIGEDIERRISTLKSIEKLENTYQLDVDGGKTEEYELEGYKEILDDFVSDLSKELENGL